MKFPHSLVVFDLDGTLVDSAADIAEAVNRLLADWSLARVDEAVIRDWIGDGVRALVQAALDHARSKLTLEQVLPGFMLHYENTLLLDPQVYPGVPDALEALRTLGVPMAICTNKPERFVQPLLAHLLLDGYFDCVVGGDSLPQRKPSPEPLLHIVQRYRLHPSECLMVGDSATDLQAAQAAGMPAALVTYGYLRGLDPRSVADVQVIGDLRELLRQNGDAAAPARRAARPQSPER